MPSIKSRLEIHNQEALVHQEVNLDKYEHIFVLHYAKMIFDINDLIEIKQYEFRFRLQLSAKASSV